MNLHPPPRQLEGDLLNFYKMKTSTPFWLYIAAMPLLIPAIILYFVNPNDNLFEFGVINILMWAYFGISIVGLIFILARSFFLKSRWRTLLVEGRVIQADVGAITETWNIKLNGWPRRTINLTVEGRPIQFHTFNNSMVQSFMKSKAEVLYHPNYPNEVLPVEMLKAKPAMIQQRVIKPA